MSWLAQDNVRCKAQIVGMLIPHGQVREPFSAIRWVMDRCKFASEDCCMCLEILTRSKLKRRQTIFCLDGMLHSNQWGWEIE